MAEHCLTFAQVPIIFASFSKRAGAGSREQPFLEASYQRNKTPEFHLWASLPGRGKAGFPVAAGYREMDSRRIFAI